MAGSHKSPQRSPILGKQLKRAGGKRGRAHKKERKNIAQPNKRIAIRHKTQAIQNSGRPTKRKKNVQQAGLRVVSGNARQAVATQEKYTSFC